MLIWIATSNEGKVREFQLLLNFLTLRFMKEIPTYPSPLETGSSFKENAYIKAHTFKSYLKNKNMLSGKTWVLAEDSGLEVKALNNKPGIYSARFAGTQATDEDNNQHLIQKMQGLTNRQARFVCCIVCFSPKGEEFVFEGSVEGSIVSTEYYHKTTKEHAKWPKNWPRFGYDPVFIPRGQTQSFYELGPDYKNQHSHRYYAVQKLKTLIDKVQKLK